MSKTAKTDDSIMSASLPQVSQVPDEAAVPRGTKEGEPAKSEKEAFAEEARLVAQIETTSEELDKKALEVVEKELGDVRASYPQPVIPPDVEDAGVIDPQQEADKVVKDGTTLDLPISETDYEKGLKENVRGKWLYQEKEVVGVSSLVAFALWVKRFIGRAHKHAKKVIFRKGEA